jgi:hypothetical protein
MFKLILSFFFLSSLFGCKVFSPEKSFVKHKAGDPIKDSHKWAFIDVPQEKFLALRDDSIGYNRLKPMSKASKIYQLLDEDLRRVDDMMRRKFPQELADVPKPTLIISDDNIENAFVSGFPVCYDVEVRFGGFISFGQVDGLEYRFANGNFSRSMLSDMKHCLKGDNSRLKGFVSSLKDHYPSCDIKLKGNTIILKGKCDVRGLLFTKKAQKLILFQPANIVVVHRGLITRSDSRLVLLSVLAHELSHYYKAHISSFKNEYGYFYDARTKRNEKPKIDGDLTNMGSELVSASEFFQAAGMMKNQIEGAVIPQNFLIMGGLSELKSDIVPECKVAFSSIENDKQLLREMNGYPFRVAKADTFKKVAGLLEACLTGYEAYLKVNSKESELTVGTVVTSTSFGDIIANKRNSTLERNMYMFYASFIFGERTEVGVIDFIKNAENYWQKMEQEAYSLHIKAKDQFLGWYTDEQEADELGTEIMAYLGYPTNSIWAYYESRMRSFEPDPFWGAIIQGKDDCIKLFEKSYKDDEGNLVSIPIGRFTNKHHSACYRLYNLVREADLHNYGGEMKPEKIPEIDALELEFQKAKALL